MQQGFEDALGRLVERLLLLFNDADTDDDEDGSGGAKLVPTFYFSNPNGTGTQTTPHTVRSVKSMTKMAYLAEQLTELIKKEPDARVILFTQYTATLGLLTQLVESLPGWACKHFDQKTAPTKRHTIIKQFQGDKSAGAQAICVTYSVAAVGITLTSASRVYLFEPCLDPGMEAQAAGRVHRLGQDKNVFIRRLAFRDSVEEVVLDVQGEVKAGRLKEFEYVQVMGLIVKRPKVTDGIKAIMRKHGLDKPHKAS